MTLAQGAKQGAAWLGASRAATQALQFMASIATARLLLPSQFGEAAIVISIATFAQIFTDLGIGAAVVHARRVTEDLLSSAFWLNFGSGAALTLTFSALAVPIAAFYGHDELVGLLIVASLNFTVGCGAVHLALLERTFHFRRIALIETTATSIGVVAVPVAAALGVGTYSLVLGPLLGTCLASAGFWASTRWFPRRRPRAARVREIWAFSRGIVGFSAVNYWSRNLDNLLLGKVATAGALGEYTRAFSLMIVPVQQMSIVLGRVLFPALARLNDDRERMGRAWTRAVSATCCLSLPITLTMIATAPALVEVLYGPRWTGMAPILELLAAGAVPALISAATGPAYRAAGQTGTLFRVGVINTVMAVAAIVAGLPWGTTGVATALLVPAFVCMPIAIGPWARIVGSSTWALVRPVIATAAPPSLGMVAAELAVRFSVGGALPVAGVLALQLAAGAAGYLIVMRLTQPALLGQAADQVRRAGGALRRLRAPAAKTGEAGA